MLCHFLLNHSVPLIVFVSPGRERLAGSQPDSFSPLKATYALVAVSDRISRVICVDYVPLAPVVAHPVVVQSTSCWLKRWAHPRSIHRREIVCRCVVLASHKSVGSILIHICRIPVVDTDLVLGTLVIEVVDVVRHHDLVPRPHVLIYVEIWHRCRWKITLA